MSTVDYARQYLDRGWAVIPLARETKLPLVPWKAFQTTPPTHKLVEAWFRAWPSANLGILTGRISGIAVMDFDGPEGLAQLERFPSTATVITGRGEHRYYALAPNQEVGTRIGFLQNVELKGDRAYCVAPPSLHQSGVPYAWSNDVPLAPLPDWVREACMNMRSSTGRGQAGEGRTPLLHEGPIPNGARNATLYRLGSRLLWEENGALSTRQIETFLRREAQRCVTPLEESELQGLIRSVARSYRG